MKKLIVLFCVVLLVFPLAMAGCGVSQVEYAAVVAQRDALQADKGTLIAERDALETERDALQAELDATKAGLTSLVAELNKKLAAVDLLLGYYSDMNKYLAGYITYDEFQFIKETFEMNFGGALGAIDNDELLQLWYECVRLSTYVLYDYEAWYSNFAAIIDLLQDMIDDDVAAIEAALD